MAKRVRFNYDGDIYEGVAHEVTPDMDKNVPKLPASIVMTDVKITTHDGQVVTYNAPHWITNKDKIKDLEDFETVADDPFFVSLKA